MKYRLMDFLVCPDCGGSLTLTAFKEKRITGTGIRSVKSCAHFCAFKNRAAEPGADNGDCRECYLHEIQSGSITCKNGHLFPILDCIPRMLPDAFNGLDSFIEDNRHLLPMELIEKRRRERDLGGFSDMQKSTKESFAYQWLRYDVESEEEDREIFLHDSQLSEGMLQGKIILDAGCGMGRYTRVAGRMGEETIGVDLSESVGKAYEKTRDNPHVHIMQADLLKLPFRKRQFDIIYSLGVLHHTPDPRAAFLNLSRCLKEEGTITIWVYGTAGQFSDFKTNPLREDRAGYLRKGWAKRIHWLVVFVRENVFRALRLLTTRLYLPLLYLFCYPLAALGKIPLLRFLTASVHANWRVRLQENFDWFSPRYQSHHSKEEVLKWFREADLTTVSALRHGFIPKVGLQGRNPPLKILKYCQASVE